MQFKLAFSYSYLLFPNSPKETYAVKLAALDTSMKRNITLKWLLKEVNLVFFVTILTL